jgi:hypothetical protein
LTELTVPELPSTTGDDSNHCDASPLTDVSDDVEITNHLDKGKGKQPAKRQRIDREKVVYAEDIGVGVPGPSKPAAKRGGRPAGRGRKAQS